MICALESIEHVEDDLDFLKALWEALAPGGLLFVSTPNQDFLPIRSIDKPFHIRHYNKEDFLRLMNLAKIPKESLICIASQNVYRPRKFIFRSFLPEEKMQIFHGDQGQFVIYCISKANKNSEIRGV